MEKILKSKKLLVLIILVALVGLFSIYLTIGKLKTVNPYKPDNIAFSKEGFNDASKLSNEDVLVAKNDIYELHFNELTTYFYIKDIKNNTIWYSNPNIEDEIQTIPNTDIKVSNSILNIQKSTLVINYSKEKGVNDSINNYEYSIKHESGEKTFSVKYLTDAVQVLYKIEDNTISYNYFPQKISVERMNELFLDKDILTDSEKTRLTKYYEKKDEGYYELTIYEKMSATVKGYLYNYMYEKSGYTFEDAIKDNASFGKTVSFDKPSFEVAVQYKLTDKGLEATVINDSITENKKFALTSIDFLPYFAATTVSDNGYYVIPDGSGAIMNFNNGKNYTSPYTKRYYGDDLALQPEVKPESTQDLLLPLYGIVKTDTNNAILSIIRKGAPMTSLFADVSGRVDSYNRINTKLNYRESERKIFINAGSKYVIDMWNKNRVQSDFIIDYHLLGSEEANYYGLAKHYQQYLVDNYNLEKTDNTKKTVLNLNLLGMYEKQEYLLGVPYKTTKSLTTFDEAIKILDELDSMNVKNINLVYDGWFNEGIDHKIATDIDINRSIGGKSDFKKLLNYTTDHDISFYPSVNIMKINDFNKIFDSIRYTSRHINGTTSKVSNYDIATKEVKDSETNSYVLKPTLYNSLVSKMLKDYNNLDVNGICLNDLGSEMSGDYRKYQEIFRNEDEYYQLETISKIDKNYDIMMYRPYGYSVVNANSILGVPLESTKYPILDGSIPFYQLVLNGYKDYSGVSINENVELGNEYQKLKAIETGSNINYVWSYKDSSVLLDTDYNYYYSTNYRNWINDAVILTQELDNLGINESQIVNHEILAKGVYKVEYGNGNVFIINYNLKPYTYNSKVVQAENYLLER